jgi:hypothetical protein
MDQTLTYNTKVKENKEIAVAINLLHRVLREVPCKYSCPRR